MTFSLRFSDVAELRNEKVDPATCSGSRYIGLEHIEQDSLSLSGWGTAEDVDSQKQRFYEGDILFGKLRPYFRKVVIAPFDGICSTDIWVVKPVIASDRDFVFYWMASDDFITRATNASEGTRMPRAKWDWVSGFELPEMSLEKRKIVGRILRVMDLTISLNRSISKTLEEIAQTIYKSWFIDFDPVKAKMAGEKPAGMDDETAALFPDSFEDSELGPIPSGWSVGSMAELFGLQGGFSFKSSSWTENGVPVVKIGSVKPGLVDLSQVSYVDEELAQKTSSAYRLPRGSLVIGLTGYVGEVGLVKQHTEIPLLNQRVAKFLPVNGTWKIPFIYCLTRKPEFKRRVIDAANGSAQQNVSNAQILSLRTIVPPIGLIESFNDQFESFFDQILLLAEQSDKLAQSRDSLLPRLISGELQIPEEMLVS